MAKFVIAGKADCPRYAEAELLADRLQRSLPNFRIHKISVLPDEWQEWLHSTCQRNGWNHDESPLIWRELVDQGGKGMLLGGFSHFAKHCQDYYRVSSEMSPDLMQHIAAENLATKMALVADERHRLSLSKPLQIWINGAPNPTCHMLVPSLLSAGIFPKVSAVDLHLLQGSKEDLEMMKMETEDMALPWLHQVTVHMDLKQAFHKAELIILLDEPDDDDDDDVTEDMEQIKKKINGLSDRYTMYANLIDARASREVKVMVSRGSLANLMCSLLLSNARSINSRHFVAIATQLENQARSVVANTLKVRTSDVKDVIVWGNVGGRFYVDLQRTKVFNYNGPIKGPPFFSLPALQIFLDRKWVNTTLQELVHNHRSTLASQKTLGAMSSAHGILTILKAWNGTSTSAEVYSLGVTCSAEATEQSGARCCSKRGPESTGLSDLPENTVLSAPVTFRDGRWSLLPDVTVGPFLMKKLEMAAREHMQEDEKEQDAQENQQTQGQAENQADGGPPKENQADGGPPKENQADGGPPKKDQADGGPPKEDQADGGPPKEDQADGGPPKETQADGGPPKETQADGGSPKEDQADGGPPKEDQADGGPPIEDQADGGPPKEDQANAGPPIEDQADGGPPKETQADGGPPEKDQQETQDPQEPAQPTESDL